MTATPKKVVHYKVDAEVVIIREGFSAFIYTVDHHYDHISNKKCVQTSTVLRYDEESGEFETLNTIYRPLKQTEIH